MQFKKWTVSACYCQGSVCLVISQQRAFESGVFFVHSVHMLTHWHSNSNNNTHTLVWSRMWVLHTYMLVWFDENTHKHTTCTVHGQSIYIYCIYMARVCILFYAVELPVGSAVVQCQHWCPAPHTGQVALEDPLPISFPLIPCQILLLRTKSHVIMCDIPGQHNGV